MRKLTQEYVENYLKSLGFLLLSEYNSYKEKMRVQCICGNDEWHVTLQNINAGVLCYDCGLKKTIEKVYAIKLSKNCLATKFPQISSEWDYEKNISLTPFDVCAGSSKKIHWICPNCGYKYCATISNRTIKNTSCKICAIKNNAINFSLASVNETYNLEYLFPEISKEWSYELNGNYIPSMMAPCSIRRVYWNCPNGHTYLTRISQRTKDNGGCTICNESKGERKIQEFLDTNLFEYVPQKRFDDCRYKNPLAFDFYLPYLNVCLEYQGIQHYKCVEYFGGERTFELRKKYDEIKEQYCKDNSIKLITISYLNMENIDKILEKELYPL